MYDSKVKEVVLSEVALGALYSKHDKKNPYSREIFQLPVYYCCRHHRCGAEQIPSLPLSLQCALSYVSVWMVSKRTQKRPVQRSGPSILKKWSSSADNGPLEW